MKIQFSFQKFILSIFRTYCEELAIEGTDTVTSLFNACFDKDTMKLVLAKVKKDAEFGPKWTFKGKEQALYLRMIVGKTIKYEIEKLLAAIEENIQTEIEDNSHAAVVLNEALDNWMNGKKDKTTISEMFVVPAEEGTDRAAKITAIEQKIAKYQNMLLDGEGNKASVQSMISKLRAKLKVLKSGDISNDVPVEEMTDEQKVSKIQTKIEELQLSLALAKKSAPEKIRSIQSMISKCRKAIKMITGGVTEEPEDEEELIDIEDISQIQDWYDGYENQIDTSKPLNKIILKAYKNLAKRSGLTVEEVGGIDPEWIIDLIFSAHETHSEDGTCLTWDVAHNISKTAGEQISATGKIGPSSLSIDQIWALTTDSEGNVYPNVDSHDTNFDKMQVLAKRIADNPKLGLKLIKKNQELANMLDIDDVLTGNEPIQNLV